MKLRSRSLWYLMVFIPSLLQAQTPKIQFEHLSQEQGVANNLVATILQDRRGFIWFGTSYGLVRYDGYSYFVYRHNPENQGSLSNDDIVSLIEDRQANLWIGTATGGLNELVRSTGEIVRFLHDPNRKESISPGTVWSILEDHTGILWIGTEAGGLDRFDPATSSFSHLKHEPPDSNSLSGDVALSLVEDSLGFLWSGTRHSGIERLDPSRKNVVNYRHDSNDPTSLSSDEVKKLYLDKDSNIWICTLGGGVSRLPPRSSAFVRYLHDPYDPNSISSNNASTIIEDRSGNYWIGTSFGLNRLDRSTRTIDRWYHESSDPSSLSGNEIAALLEDKSGLLWVGSRHGGVDKLFTGIRFISLFRHYDGEPATLSGSAVHAAFEDHAGNLWIGTNRGLDKFSDSTNTFQHFTWSAKNPGTTDDHSVNAIAEDHLGNLWMGTDLGLWKMKADGTTIAWYRHDAGTPGSLCSDHVTSIHFERGDSSELWIGTSAGLDRMNISEESFYHFSNSDGNPPGLKNKSILSLLEDRTGSLWIGTTTGLAMLDSGGHRFKYFTELPGDPKSLSNNYCLTLMEGRDGELWIGTAGGLNRLDGATGNFSHFSRNEGLGNGIVCGIVEAPQGTLWLSTYGGVFRFDTRTSRFTHFDVSDGLQGNMFSPNAFTRRANGNIVFGGVTGMNVIIPGDIPRNAFVPPVVITSFMLFDNTNKDFASSHPEFSSIELSYKENFFALAFAALDYTQPEKNQYTFKLEGFDDNWIQGGRTRFARYMNLAPGEYFFRVKGSNSDGVWNETSTDLRIVIAPPFWRTWWFYSLAAITVVAGAFVSHVQRVKEKVKRLTELERVRDAENKRVRKRAADDFHDEFGHKLTKISLLSQVIKRSLGDSAGTDHLDKIIGTSNELSMGMRDFLWTLNPDRDTVYDVAIRLKDFGDELYNSSGIGFRVNGLSKDLEHIQLSLDWRRHLTLMFKEAMNNTVKHSGCRNAMLDIVQQNGSIEITLTDDGKGFSTEIVSPGQGLSSMRNRAEKIHGTFDIRSERGNGTIVRFRGNLPRSSSPGKEDS